MLSPGPTFCTGFGAAAWPVTVLGVASARYFDWLGAPNGRERAAVLRDSAPKSLPNSLSATDSQTPSPKPITDQ
jgi:hypothetical protein